MPKQSVDQREQRSYASVHPFLEDTVEQIILHFPELKSLRPATDALELATILDKTGETAEQFLRNIVNVLAREKIVEERFSEKGRSVDRQEVQDDYLILRQGNDLRGTLEEYRMDGHGNRLPQVGLDKGFFVTSNFALSAAYFSPQYQANSKFRYLGDEKMDGQDAFVVAFAQDPLPASIPITMQGRWGALPYLAHLLVQGIAWIDKSNFQILRMRTDLLGPRRDIGLLRLTTEVSYGEQRLADDVSPLWLVNDVKVYAHFSRIEATGDGYTEYQSLFRNEHRLRNYRRYQVSAKVGGETVTAAQNEPNREGFGDNGRSRLMMPEQISDVATQVYVNEPVEQIVKQVSQLKSLRAVADQQSLATILRKTGERVDEFFANIVDLTAHEKITQARLNNLARVLSSENTQDNYLIVHRSGGTGAGIEEYRTDASGHRTDSRGLSSGYFVTSGFALNCNYFSTGFQPESVFRYLGTQKMGGRETYVVAFAQKPSKATLVVTLRGPEGTTVYMLAQGIAWIDQETSQVLRLRTDLLAPLYAIGLDRLATEVNFSEVRLEDVATPLWLPREVSVRIFMSQYSYQTSDYYEQIYQNGHRYTDYQRFRVGVKIGP